MLGRMRIENTGIIISEIFTFDESEKIEIDSKGETITITLRDTSSAEVEMSYSPQCFKELLDAMVAAERELNKLGGGNKEAGA